MRAVIIAASLLLLAHTVVAQTFFVFQSSNQWKVSQTLPADATVAATVTYQPLLLQTGWDVLNVSTNAAVPDAQQAYAAGYGEGLVTYQSIIEAYNSYATPHANETKQYLLQNWDYMLSQSQWFGATDPYWHQVGLEVQQFQGMLDGINSGNANASRRPWTAYDLHIIVSQGDLIDLDTAWPPATLKHWRNMNSREFATYFHKKTHCSALIKVKPDLSDIFFGHATWASFSTMSRIFKHYFLNYNGVVSKEVSFSGYPGTLTSTDDFYVTDSGLAIIETTNNIFNESLYAALTPDSLLYWVRLKVATRLATSASTWMQLFFRENGGTYNNQWMVLNLNLFTPNQDLQPGTLWIGEQLPGTYEAADATSILSYGYWPSYNVPYFPRIFTLSGYPQAIEQQGPVMLDYQTCARAKIFRRNQSDVVGMPEMMEMMQFNQYETDPFSVGDPTQTIAARGDLFAADPGCFGAIDAKISSFNLFKAKRQILAYNGPTPQQGNFDWSKTKIANLNTSDCRHFGQPTLFNFEFQSYSPLQ